MINKKFIQKIRKDYKAQNEERRQIISLSNIVLHDSKRIIFALHREDFQTAENKLMEVEKIIIKIQTKFTAKRAEEEGSYKAALEEYVEAKMFYLIIMGKKIDKIQGLKINFDSYLGGICDTTGELVRRATNKAADGDFTEVKKIKNIIEDVMEELAEFDMTGYLRTKYDQARGNLRKIEQINYEIKIRK